MLNIPILRWGAPYESLDKEEVFHFITGEPVARVSQANTGLLARDMRKVERARECLREIPAAALIEMMKKAAGLYLDEALPMGDEAGSARASIGFGAPMNSAATANSEGRRCADSG